MCSMASAPIDDIDIDISPAPDSPSSSPALPSATTANAVAATADRETPLRLDIERRLIDLADGLIQQLRVSERFALAALAAGRLVSLWIAEWQVLRMARRARPAWRRSGG